MVKSTTLISLPVFGRLVFDTVDSVVVVDFVGVFGVTVCFGVSGSFGFSTVTVCALSFRSSWPAMESVNMDKEPVVVNHLKKKSRESDRYLPISEYELMLFDKIKRINDQYGYSDEDYMFVGPSGRYHIRAVDNRIRKLCRNAGIPEKSCHDIRRSVASLLHANKVPVEKIRAYMGHNDINTTWGYIYDVDSEEVNKNIMKNALKELNSLEIR